MPVPPAYLNRLIEECPLFYASMFLLPKLNTTYPSIHNDKTSEGFRCDMHRTKVLDFLTWLVWQCMCFLDLEWKILYVGSADDFEHDQVLEEVMVGPVPVGVNKFVLQVSSEQRRRDTTARQLLLFSEQTMGESLPTEEGYVFI